MYSIGIKTLQLSALLTVSLSVLESEELEQIALLFATYC